MRIRTGVMGIVLGGFMTARAHAHGVVGQRSFIEPFITAPVLNAHDFQVRVDPAFTIEELGQLTDRHAVPNRKRMVSGE